MRNALRVRIVFLIAAATLAQPIISRSAELNSFPGIWLNSPPVQPHQLRGKLVVLYFFEEQCPKCKGLWPDRLAFAKKYADQPVVFIAVNSGNAPDTVQAYLRQSGINWPTIVDVDRSFEQAASVGPISLQNIMQVAVITPEGKLEPGNWNDWQGTVDRYLDKANWKVDPAEIPDALKPAWRDVELGNYGGAAATLAKSKQLRDPKSVAAMDQLNAAIAKEVIDQMEAAKGADEAGNKWDAYKKYQSIARSFKALPDAKQAQDAAKKLAENAAVIQEQKAASQLKKASQIRALPGTPGEKRAKAAVQKIVDDYPNTEAGKKAREMLGGK